MATFFQDITDRKRAEEALRSKSEDLAAILDIAPVQIWFGDAECKRFVGNRRAYEEHRLRPGSNASFDAPNRELPEGLRLEVAGRTLTPEEMPMQIAARTGKPVLRFEHDVIHPDGVRQTMWANVVPLFNPDGKLRGVIGVYVDITERKRAEEALRESEGLLSAVLKQLPVGLGVTDVSGRWIVTNALMDKFVPKGIPSTVPERIGRWHAYDADGKPVPPENWPGQRALRGDIVSPGLEMTFLDDDRQERWMRVSAAPLRDDAGQIIGTTCVVQDIDAIKKAEQALRRSEEQLALVSNTVPALISYVDSECRYRFCNRAYEQWFGIPCERIIGRTLREVLGDAAWKTIEPHILGALEGRVASFEAEAKYAHGGARWIHAIYTPHRDEQGKVIGVVVMVSDISNRKRVEAELQQAHEQLANRAVHLETLVQRRTRDIENTLQSLESFCYSIAHDLRAPVRAMHSFACILLEEYASKLDETAQDYARRIAGAALRMEDLIQALLSYGHFAQMDIPEEPVHLEELVKRILSDLSVEIRQAQASVEIQGPLPEVRANSVLLGQSLQNFISNALKFVAEGNHPEVRIGAERRGHVTRIWVRDNGIGIKEEHRVKLFKPFERIDSEHRFPGVGIGLAIAKKAAERMNGQVGVQSSPGKGSEFWIELPVKED